LYKQVIYDFLLYVGLQVKALVRDPSKLPDHLRSSIEVIQGDVTKAEDVLQTVEGQDAVVVTLGTRNDLGVLIFSAWKMYVYLVHILNQRCSSCCLVHGKLVVYPYPLN
jgi:putative NADH-flavin reductase